MATLGRERRWLWLAIVALLLGLVPTAVAGTTAPAPGGAWVAVGSMVSGRKGHTATLLADGTVLVVGGVADGRQTLASAERYDPATGSWRVAASLATPRYGQTATLLRDGTVLVTGGFNVTISPEGYPDYQFLSSAERYDPRTDVWRPAGAMSAERAGQTATLLRDGTVLVAGCYCLSVDAATAEIYDPAADTWLAPTQMVEWHGNHTATLLADGRVLVAGADGIDGPPLQDAELYDPATASWSRTGDMREGRIGQTATLLPDGTVLVTGGSDTFNYLASAERYDPATGIWQLTGAMRDPRAYYATAVLPDGTVLAAGGNHGEQPGLAERYDPASGTWAVAPHMAVDREESAAVALRDGTVLVIGGSDGERTLASAELFDPRLPAPPAPAALPGSWQPTGPLTAKRSDHTATLLADGSVLLVGGTEFDRAGAERYDPASDTWSSAGRLKQGRYGHTATLLGDRTVLVVGGSGYAGATAERYDPATGAWSSAASPRTSHAFHTATLLPDGTVLVVGGAGEPSVGGPSPTSDAERYDPATDTWRAIAPLPIGLSQHTAVLLRDGGVMIVGRREAAKGTRGDPVTASVRYDPASDTWQIVGSLNQWHPYPAALALPDGTVLVVDSQDAAERYDPALGTWRVVAQGATRHLLGYTATLLRDGTVLVVGAGSPGYLIAAERYDPATDRWSPVARPTVARADHTATLLDDGTVLVAGGFNWGAGHDEASAERFIPPGGAAPASPTPTPIPSATPVPTAVPSPIPSAAPLPGMPPTGGGGKAPDSRWRLPLLVLGAAALLVLAGLVSPPRRAARARRVE